MSKLKTLKDLEKDLEWKYDTIVALKQEAIKWHNEYQKNIVSVAQIKVSQFIREFFNITEDSLKATGDLK